MRNDFKDIVITGSAVISAAGIGVEPVLELIRTGTDAFVPLPADVLGAEGFRWAKASGFTASAYMPPMKARKMDRCSQFAVAATGMALKDAALDPASIPSDRLGIALGSGFCGVSPSAEFLTGYFTSGVEGLLPMIFPNTVPNAPASNASIEHRFRGPNVTVVQRFCSAESAFLLACRYLQGGRADVMLTGGADELIPLLVKGFHELGQYPEGSVPFGEGCGLLVLETADHARRRGARILGSVESVRSIGMLVPGHERQGLELLAGRVEKCSLISVSGCTEQVPGIADLLADKPLLRVGHAVGRSLAMGGTALATMIASLKDGDRGMHLAASPEGPCFSLDITGGGSV